MSNVSLICLDLIKQEKKKCVSIRQCVGLWRSIDGSNTKWSAYNLWKIGFLNYTFLWENHANE